MNVAYRLAVRPPVQAEVRAIAQKQLARAERELVAAAVRFDRDRIHTARKRLKKVRALVHLVQPALAKAARRDTASLRKVNRRLGVLSDGAAVVDAVTRLSKQYPRMLTHSTAAALRRWLVRREAVADHIAGTRRALSRSTRLVRTARAHAGRWTLRKDDFAAVAGGLERTFRRARRAMRRAGEHPTARRLHDWRRRAKDHWLQLRLLEARCARSLGADTRVLEALDDVLGAYHDLALLREAVEYEHSLTREKKASVLRAVARARRRLRARAQTSAARAYRENPHAFVRRVERLWTTS
jgi:CHAD domain-containing protein